MNNFDNTLIPDSVMTNALSLGRTGEVWVRELPSRLERLQVDWRLRSITQFEHSGAGSWAGSAIDEDGISRILKIALPCDPADDPRLPQHNFEADALRAFGSDVAAAVVRSSADGFEILLEQCVPGTDLRKLPFTESDVIAADILPKLWVSDIGTTSYVLLTDAVSRWVLQLKDANRLIAYPPDLANRIVAVASTLVESQSTLALLHGDFHPGNVLASERKPWLVIDPKPVIGEPAFDLAQWLLNIPLGEDRGHNVKTIHDKIMYFADRLDLNAARIAGWALVKSAGWEWPLTTVELFDHVYARLSGTGHSKEPRVVDL